MRSVLSLSWQPLLLTRGRGIRFSILRLSVLLLVWLVRTLVRHRVIHSPFLTRLVKPVRRGLLFQ
jgi:hypothetical protein